MYVASLSVSSSKGCDDVVRFIAGNRDLKCMAVTQHLSDGLYERPEIFSLRRTAFLVAGKDSETLVLVTRPIPNPQMNIHRLGRHLVEKTTRIATGDVLMEFHPYPVHGVV